MEMKSPEQIIPQTNKDFKIEHYAGLDVVLNLNSSAYDRESLLEIVKEETKAPKLNTTYSGLLDKIDDLNNEDGFKRFFVKFKHASSQQNVNFIRGHTQIDYLTKKAQKDFDREARYAHVGISSEMVLSKKIKSLIASEKFQELAQKYGFTNFKFSEPIMAIVVKQYREKHLIYKNIRSPRPLTFRAPHDLVLDLKKIFLDNGINAHDLRPDQFMVTEDERGFHLYLIDIEAYTEKKSPENN